MRFPFRLIASKTNINFIKYRLIAFVLSAIISIASLGGLGYKGLNYGVDFTGGVAIEIKAPIADQVTNSLRDILKIHGHHAAIIQNVGLDSYLIRFQPHSLDEQEPNAISKEIELIKASIMQQLPTTEFRKVDFVGPKVGKELIDRAMIAFIMSVIGILGYIGFRFNWQFGIAAIIALVHDAIATIGFFVFSRIEFDTTSIAAILTILGYSINDTVVIYDRIRENLKKYRNLGFAELVNLSINETLSRTIMTVMTVLLVCLCLVLYSGDALYGFSLVMFFGVAFGTYSSIYIAAPALLYTKKHLKL